MKALEGKPFPFMGKTYTLYSSFPYRLLMIGDNRSMRPVTFLTSSIYRLAPLFGFDLWAEKRELVCRFMTSRTSPAQYSPHRLIIANYE